jgi:hypothetical protein
MTFIITLNSLNKEIYTTWRRSLIDLVKTTHRLGDNLYYENYNAFEISLIDTMLDIDPHNPSPTQFK